MVPTAEEIFYSKEFSKNSSLEFEDVENLMIEFAKMHVEEALKEAYEKAGLEYYGDEVCYDKDSIITAYPLENVK